MSDLHSSFNEYQEIFEKVPSAIIVLDERGTVAKANHSALCMLGISDLVGRKWYEVINAVFRPQKDDGQEISTVDGKKLQVSTTPLSHGQLVQMTDQTATRQLTDKVNHMERLSSLGRMAASLAHQIRTPLSAAILYAANLGNANLPATARSTFQKKLMSRLQALESQVSDILMYARSGEQSVKALDAVDIVEDVSASVVSVVERNGAQLTTDIGPRPMRILGNVTALNGAITNLVTNAIEAGAKKVNIRLDADDKNIMISVKNNGPQISKETQRKIFEPFFTTKSNGTGLGLAVVMAVAKVHQGKVELTSDEDETVFTLLIPKYTGDLEPSSSNIAGPQKNVA
jgi:two-component system sensor histidine kinase FlrB